MCPPPLPFLKKKENTSTPNDFHASTFYIHVPLPANPSMPLFRTFVRAPNPKLPPTHQMQPTVVIIWGLYPHGHKSGFRYEYYYSSRCVSRNPLTMNQWHNASPHTLAKHCVLVGFVP